ncbi:O-antigen ligase family protein [Devosia sediminis]|uniref:O-antigen ligase family protein n=1 Tax=Devosia sediminis TaxID=2798801 RepID=A0A934IVD7_9HYPH|nr:O-antigen ligase family protein [Devosia sediminis]MBJ3785047.1 O-antigen ligase family protein [Devosia sediminis]
MTSYKSILPALALIAVFAMSPVAPEAGNTIFLIVGALGLLLAWPGSTQHVRRPIVWMPLFALGLLAVAYLAAAGFDGLVGVLYFAPMLAVLPLLGWLGAGSASTHVSLIGVSALGGATGAAIMAIIEVQATGTTRAGEMVANPIHFADVALLVGMVALVGAATISSHQRFIFVVAPLMAAIAVVLSGTRGAVVAYAAMIIVALVTAACVRLVPRRVLALSVIALGLVGVVAVVLGAGQLSAISRITSDFAAAMLNGLPTGASTDLRMQMYAAGFQAFLAAPIFGHGPIDFTNVASALANGAFSGTPHLHNDIVDMAASAGIFGLVAYGLLLLAPIVEALRAPPSAHRSFTIVLTVTLVAGFFVMGLTNAMFGILTLTTTFAAICVMVGLLTTPDNVLIEDNLSACSLSDHP